MIIYFHFSVLSQGECSNIQDCTFNVQDCTFNVQYVHSVFKIFFFNIQDSFNVQDLFNVSSRFIQYSLKIYSMFIQDLFKFYSIFI